MTIYFPVEKQKIFLLYKYYLLSNDKWLEKEKIEDEKQKARITWFFNCLEKEKYLIEQIEKKLKTGWEFSRLPPLEKALLIFSSYEIIFQKDVPIPLLIDQAVIFSKKYLEEEKYKYINKALDLISKEKWEEKIKAV